MVRNSKKVFGIGLGRTGTKSLAHAMKLLGYTIKHEPAHIDLVLQHDYLGGLLIAARYKFLDFAYREAKFILTVREIESWLRSAENFGRNKYGFPSRCGRFGSTSIPLRRAELRYHLYGSCCFDRDKFEKNYWKHQDDVVIHFTDRIGKLLIMDICGGDGWEVLCPFLGIDVPSIKFPHMNRGKYEQS